MAITEDDRNFFDEIEQVKQKLENDPKNAGLNRRLLLLLSAEERNGEALLYGLRGAELPAHNRVYGRTLIRLLVNLGLPRLAGVLVVDPEHATAMDEIAFVVAARALRRSAHASVRARVLEEGMKRFPDSVDLRNLANAQ